jgi:protein required for attachment to host cells
MIEDGRTLVVLADGRRVRLLEEARLAGPLHEHVEWLRGVAPFEQPDGTQPVTVHARTGGSTHASHEPPRDKGERRFLTDLAEHLEQLVRAHHFDHLAIMAPPRALGVLRKALPAALAKRVAVTDPHDRLDESIVLIESHLRAARLRVAG